MRKLYGMKYTNQRIENGHMVWDAIPENVVDELTILRWEQLENAARESPTIKELLGRLYL